MVDRKLHWGRLFIGLLIIPFIVFAPYYTGELMVVVSPSSYKETIHIMQYWGLGLLGISVFTMVGLMIAVVGYLIRIAAINLYNYIYTEGEE